MQSAIELDCFSFVNLLAEENIPFFLFFNCFFFFLFSSYQLDCLLKSKEFVFHMNIYVNRNSRAIWIAKFLSIFVISFFFTVLYRISLQLISHSQPVNWWCSVKYRYQIMNSKDAFLPPESKCFPCHLTNCVNIYSN